MRTLMWFRADLRMRDNPALHAAASAGTRGVVAVFVVCTEQWRTHGDAPVKIDLRRRCLLDLSDALARRNIGLRILHAPRFDGVARVLLGLARETECDALFFNREYEVNERRRDEAVERAFDGAGLSCRGFSDQCVLAPGSVRTKAGTVYTVFSPFRKAWKKVYEAEREGLNPLGLPRKADAMVGRPDTVPEVFDGFAPSEALASRWPAGEPHARRRLKAFVADRLIDYARDRDGPDLDATSGLSPYLAAGCVSARQCLQAALDRNDGRAEGGHAGPAAWIDELIWREFFRHIIVGFPRVSMGRAFKLETERIRWRWDDDHFAAWAAGRTGFPIVDAGMRQLAATGWMHNRLRMIVAMFLAKNLLLDWRVGERFFMEHLVDGDLASNNGGWQWAASTGTDAAPYFRIFNPVSQSKRFDATGSFIRRWVPELADLDGDAIHRAPAAEGLFDSTGYPGPIVDLRRSRERAIAAFQSL